MNINIPYSMNIKHYILSISLLFLYSTSFSQITIFSTDLLDVGDSIQLASVNPVPPGFKPGPAGPDQHWDFSGLVMDTSSILRFVDPASTPYGANFPASNIAVEGLVDDLGLEGWAYGTKNLSVFQIDGAAGSYDIIEDIVAPFNPPEVMFDFPVNYLDSLEQTTTIDIKVDSPEPTADSIRVKVVTSLDSRVDAWGEVMTPVWTGQVLRFREVRTTIDSSWVKIIFFWVFLQANTNISVTYKYMANNVGYPVVQFNADTSDSQFSMINYVLDDGVGTSDQKPFEKIAFNIYPNPASTEIYCRLQHAEAEGEISIYDLHGRQLKTIPMTSGQQQYKMDVSAYTAGLYQVVLRTDGKGVSAKKFVIR